MSADENPDYVLDNNPKQKNKVWVLYLGIGLPKVIQRLAELHPDWEIEYEYAEEWAESAGCFEKEDDGMWYETKRDYRSSEAIETFCEIWGRSEDFEWCSQLSRYVGVDEKASIRLLPRVEKDYYEYYKREVEGSSKEMLFEHSQITITNKLYAHFQYDAHIRSADKIGKALEM